MLRIAERRGVLKSLQWGAVFQHVGRGQETSIVIMALAITYLTHADDIDQPSPLSFLSHC